MYQNLTCKSYFFFECDGNKALFLLNTDFGVPEKLLFIPNSELFSICNSFFSFSSKKFSKQRKNNSVRTAVLLILGVGGI
jgi:hypothetical protein